MASKTKRSKRVTVSPVAHQSTPLGEYARKHALNIAFKQVPTRPDGKGWGAGTRHFHYTMTRTEPVRVALTGYYSMGSGLKGAPTADELLNSLYLDASCGEGTFEDYCSNMGCDPDSREQERIFRSCRDTRKSLERMLLNLEVLGMAVQEQGL